MKFALAFLALAAAGKHILIKKKSHITLFQYNCAYDSRIMVRFTQLMLIACKSLGTVQFGDQNVPTSLESLLRLLTLRVSTKLFVWSSTTLMLKVVSLTLMIALSNLPRYFITNYSCVTYINPARCL